MAFKVEVVLATKVEMIGEIRKGIGKYKEKRDGEAIIDKIFYRCLIQFTRLLDLLQRLSCVLI